METGQLRTSERPATTDLTAETRGDVLQTASCLQAVLIPLQSSDYAASTNRWNEPPNELASPAVTALLRRHGFGGTQSAAPSEDADEDESDDD